MLIGLALTLRGFFVVESVALEGSRLMLVCHERLWVELWGQFLYGFCGFGGPGVGWIVCI